MGTQLGKHGAAFYRGVQQRSPGNNYLDSFSSFPLISTGPFHWLHPTRRQRAREPIVIIHTGKPRGTAKGMEGNLEGKHGFGRVKLMARSKNGNHFKTILIILCFTYFC